MLRLTVSLLFALCALTVSVHADSSHVARSVADVSWAIGQSRPHMALALRRRLAAALIDAAKAHDFDPYTGVAIIAHESHWHPGLVSPDGEDYGLSQQRARYYPGCDSARPAAKDDSDSCNAVKARLLNPIYSIRRMAGAITAWRKTCRRITGKAALFHRWLHGYGGMGKMDRSGRPILICHMKKDRRGRWRDTPLRPQLRAIIRYRKQLIRRRAAAKRRRRK